MRRLSSIFISLFMSVGAYLYASYSDTMQVKYSYKTWAEVVQVEEKFHHYVSSRYGDMSYTYVSATVRLPDNESVKVKVTFNLMPKVGNCLPIVVTQFLSGEIVGFLEKMAWQTNGPIVESCRKKS